MQRDRTPLYLIAICGGTALAWMAWKLGFSLFAEWFFYPSLLFWTFCIHQLVIGIPKPCDRKIWKACQWWSGIWLLWFILGFCAIPFSVVIWIPLATIITDGFINPFLALILHLVIWAAATDIIRNIDDPNHSDLPANP